MHFILLSHACVWTIYSTHITGNPGIALVKQGCQNVQATNVDGIFMVVYFAFHCSWPVTFGLCLIWLSTNLTFASTESIYKSDFIVFNLLCKHVYYVQLADFPHLPGIVILITFLKVSSIFSGEQVFSIYQETTIK